MFATFCYVIIYWLKQILHGDSYVCVLCVCKGFSVCSKKTVHGPLVNAGNANSTSQSTGGAKTVHKAPLSPKSVHHAVQSNNNNVEAQDSQDNNFACKAFGAFDINMVAFVFCMV